MAYLRLFFNRCARISQYLTFVANQLSLHSGLLQLEAVESETTAGGRDTPFTTFLNNWRALLPWVAACKYSEPLLVTFARLRRVCTGSEKYSRVYLSVT